MNRARFVDWCASRFPNPADALGAYFEDAAAAALSVGALLDTLPEVDGKRHYLPNLTGRNDKRQLYVASIEQDKDGTAWPCVTFKSFKGSSVYWKPRDLAWQEYEAAAGLVAANDNTRRDYQAAALAAIEAGRAKAAEREREQEAGREAAAAVALAAWEAAEPCEVHQYLTRKGVEPHGLRVARRDMRARLWNDEAGTWQDVAAVRAGDLLIPMHDAAGRLVSLQRIDATGRKRFIMGGRAHGSHFLIHGTTGRTVLVEGYATGASWHAATGDCVVLAFNAGALPVVAGYLAADLVAADHDASGTGEKAARATGLPWIMPPELGDWNDYTAAHGIEAMRAAVANGNAEIFARPYDLPAVELKGREQTWWNKLGAADTPAEAAALAWAIGRRLCVRVPVLMELDDLAELLRQAAPAGMMHPDTLAAIRDALGRIVEWRKRRALAGVSMSPEALERHRVETVEVLPRLTGEDYSGVVLLNTPMGSGKTRDVGQPFANWAKHQDARFVATCHRQSLVRELANVLGCDHYNETPGEMAWAVQALATCLPSLVKNAHAQIVDEAGYLFVDEIAQVLRSIAGNVTIADKKTRADVFHALRAAVSRARCIMGADAGMDNRVLAFLEACRPGEQFRVIQQPHQAAGLAVSFGYGPDALASAYGEALARLSQGERLWVSCSEKMRAIEAARVLGASGARVLLLHGDNREGSEQAEFFGNPEAVSLRYDVLIHTGVISSGLSIRHQENGKHFTHGMFLGSGAKITPADALQMLRRVRYLTTWTVAVTPNNAKDIDNADAILEGMEQAASLEGMTAARATDFDSFVAGIEADEARQRADFGAGFWWALGHQGFDLKRMEPNADEALAADLKAIRAELRDEHRAAILGADDLTDEEARRLRDCTNRTEAEQFALLRHRIKTDLGLQDLDDEALDVWDDGRGPRRMDRFSAAVLRLADRNDHTGEDLAMHRFSKARALAYPWLLDGFDLAPGLRITADLAGRIIGRVIERRFLLAFLGIVPAKWARHMGTEKDGTPKPFPFPAYPVRELGEILERLGLDLKRREGAATHTSGDHFKGDITPSVGKTARQCFHEVTAESWEHVSRWAESRNARRAASEVKPTAPAPAGFTDSQDGVFWLEVRRDLWKRSAAEAMTREQVAAELVPLLRTKPPTAAAKLTAWWAREVLTVAA